MTGGNTPGMLDDATITSRNSVRAASPPVAAMAPIFQTTVSLLSRSVVATSRSRPLADSRATSRIMASVTNPSTSCRRGSPSKNDVAEQAKNTAAPNQTFAAVTDERVGQLRIPVRSEERKRRNQRAGADPRHQFELGPCVRAVKSHQGARPESTAGAAARKREDIERAVCRSGAQTHDDIRGRPIEPPIDTKGAHRWGEADRRSGLQSAEAAFRASAASRNPSAQSPQPETLRMFASRISGFETHAWQIPPQSYSSLDFKEMRSVAGHGIAAKCSALGASTRSSPLQRRAWPQEAGSPMDRVPEDAAQTGIVCRPWEMPFMLTVSIRC